MNDAQTAASSVESTRLPPPVIRTLTLGDLSAALKAGLNDFRRAPFISLFFGVFYAAGGIFLVASAARLEMGWIVYPLMVGFALVGPFTAVGLYEVSRRLENGERPKWGSVISVIWEQRKGEIAWMGFFMIFVLVIWMYQVRMLLALFLGMKAFSGFDGLVQMIFTTEAGLYFLLAGHAWGAALAMIVFVLTVVSIPLLLDREYDIVTAIVTSVKAVKQNAKPMLVWGAIVIGALFVSSLPAFLGLIVTLPVLGHATWHLYRRTIEPAE